MKRVLLLLCVCFSIYTYSQDQFNIGINGGITIGNVEEVSSIGFGADVNYLFDVSEDFVVGPSIGIVLFNVEEDDILGVELEAPSFLPISASLFFRSLEDKFYVGGELGYAVSLSEQDSGVFIKPTIGYMISDSFKINAFYAGIKTSGPTFGYAGIGLAYDLLGRHGARYSF